MSSELWDRHSYGLRLLALALLLGCGNSIFGQVAPCPDPVPQTAGTHRFRRAGESFSIPITMDDCQPVTLDVRWSNGANNGSNFVITFLDDNSQPVFSKQLWGFMTGNEQFPFTSLDTNPWLGTASMMAVPTAVTIQAVQPFAFPSVISYRVTRISRHPKRVLQGIDAKLMTWLLTAPGKRLTEGQDSKSITYTLDQLAFDEPREVERNGRKETVENAFRLTLKVEESLNVGLIWIDDRALPAFLSPDRRHVLSLIYDASILKDGAEISVSRADGNQLHSLGATLKLPPSFRPPVGRSSDEGNSIVCLRSAIRTVGSSRHPLVQLELRTNRPFPARQSPLQLQVGKRFFRDELTGDHTGRLLTLSLTPEMFAELKDGSEIVAFFDLPDHSGASSATIWNFGRLNKSLLDRP